MCLAIPSQIVELLDNGMARARVGNSETFLTASVSLLPEPAKVGDFMIVHAGFALHKLDPTEAETSLDLLREMAQLVEGKPADF
ncbi:MAG: HypC/HybG/HupF family hydrogenase formation chaperone [Deltaproteobacteria bacterium]|jgi:hydrogenase expression/formation protein HypC|nr:HypC/HybG/HupF family hydrogenase formation chaperone [Deltaproteobacteria bacterium]